MARPLEKMAVRVAFEEVSAYEAIRQAEDSLGSAAQGLSEVAGAVWEGYLMPDSYKALDTEIRSASIALTGRLASILRSIDRMMSAAYLEARVNPRCKCCGKKASQCEC